MNKEEIQAEIKAMQERLNILSTELEKCENEQVLSVWKPKENEKFYYILCDGGIYGDKFDSANLQNSEIVHIGNYYKTEEEAEFEAQREKFTRLFRKYVKEHSEPLDWENFEQEKWYCAYNYLFSRIEYHSVYSYQHTFQIYASSKEILQDAIKFIGEDNFKKYILEVKKGVEI